VGQPPTSGFVFNIDTNLWILSGDANKQRRLTHFSLPTEFASEPVWSPDGKSITYTYLPQISQDKAPATQIWSINPDGTGAKQLVTSQGDESLSTPYWSPDGKYLYFTVEASNTGPSDSGWVVQQNRRIDRVEVATGTRSQWMPQARMPSTGGTGDDVLYLEEIMDPQGAGAIGQRLMRAKADGTGQAVLVDEKAYSITHGPRISPDNKWVVFAATNPFETAPSGGFNFFKWLLFEPEVAEAHDIPWDLYLVPLAGGEPRRLTKINEDQPFPTWLDNNTIAALGVNGLYKVSIDAQGMPTTQPARIHSGAQHSTLTWYEP
jgi:Tol biopolymer transport system component